MKNKNFLKELILLFIFAILISVVIVFFYSRIWLAAGLLLILSILKLVYLKDKVAVTIFIIGGIYGTLAEMVAIYFGAWSYSYINFYNIPFWLFFAWGAMSIFFYRLSSLIKLYFKRK
ncbi:MAG: hypothetical protein AABY22_02865 [Nanoarchaeota archaeon]